MIQILFFREFEWLFIKGNILLVVKKVWKIYRYGLIMAPGSLLSVMFLR